MPAAVAHGRSRCPLSISNRASTTVFVTMWPWPLGGMPSDCHRVYV